MAFLVVFITFFCYFVPKGIEMTYAEYLMKCESVAKVLVKIASGANVSPVERAKAIKDAIELFNHETSQNKQ